MNKFRKQHKTYITLIILITIILTLSIVSATDQNTTNTTIKNNYNHNTITDKITPQQKDPINNNKEEITIKDN